MFSKNRNKFKNFISNINKLAPTVQSQEQIQPPVQQQNVNQSSTVKKDVFGGQSNLFNNTNKKSGDEKLIMKANYNSTAFKEAHIKGTQQLLGINSILGGSTHNSRKEKGHDSYNSSLKYVVESINQFGGSNGKKGFLFSDCDLTAHDMNYLSTTMINSNHNFAIVDFSNNPKIDALAIDYLLKGASGILSVQQGNLTDFNLMYQGILTRSNFNFHKLDLSGCNIGNVGIDILKHAFTNSRLKSLKSIDLSGNGISISKMSEFLSEVNQDLFVITEKSYAEGKAVYKDSNGTLYDMHIKSDGKDAVIEFADGITGISGVSAGDTCPPTVKEQMKACIGGGVGATVATWSVCSGDIKAKLICAGGAFLTGCAATVATVASTQCVMGGEYKDNGNSNFGFTVDGGHEIQGTYIDNDNGLKGSNFDLTQHDFNFG